MKIILCVNAAWNVWNFRRPLVTSLVAAGHEVTVLAPADDSVEQIEALGCHFIDLKMNVKGLNPLDDLALMFRLRRIFREERPDVVLSYTIKNNIFGALAAKPLNLPVLPNVTGLGTAFLSGNLLERVAVALYRKAFGGLPVVFFQNADDRDLFLRRQIITEAQARLLPGSGIDLDYFAPAPYPPADQAPVFLMIARLLRDKGVMEFVDAARKMKAVAPHLRFQLLGATDAHNRTAIDRASVQSWQDEGVIDYLGTTPDVRPALAAAHCIVLPSYREGAPRTLIEGAAMARPLIATDVPGCRAVVDHGTTGFLCAPRNSDSLAEAMQAFLALDPEARAAMGMAGRGKMQREYGQEIVVGAYHNAIGQISPGQSAAR